MIEITEEDIKYAEKIFLPEGNKFDQKRKKVIKCLESKDIVACPGSGKTTALLAKLAILANKMPLKNNKGICVLTHTNVAIDEITNRLDKKGKKLFDTPNFFGTFQTFVNQFLAIPAYINYFGKKPYNIDKDLYNESIDKYYNMLNYRTRKYWLERKRKYMDYLKNIRFSLEDFNVLVKKLNGKSVFKNKCDSFKNILEFKLEILKKGYLCYDDAYSLAFRYLKDFEDLLRKTFSQRFQYIFVDEMQDTNSYQIKLLKVLFDSDVIVQKIGDPNQAIFNSVGSSKNKLFWEFKDNNLTIADSKRFSSAVADKVEKLCYPPKKIEGNNNSEDQIKPKIIIFNDETVEEVLPKYAQIIKENNLLKINKPVFKAVGFVGKKREDNKLTLSSYYKNYNPTKKIKKKDFDSLSGYLSSIYIETNYDEANVYRKIIIRALLKVLKISNFKTEDSYLTERTLFKYLKEKNKEFYNTINIKLAEWCLDLYNDKSIFNDLKCFIRNEFFDILGIEVDEEVNDFLIASDLEEESTIEVKKDFTNIYEYESINIKIGTVHSVKGETHTATLYLETFWYKYEFERLIKYLKSSPAKKPSIRVKTNLKIAFVGMSRPSDLLCVAIHEKRVNDHVKDLKKSGWEICYV